MTRWLQERGEKCMEVQEGRALNQPRELRNMFLDNGDLCNGISRTNITMKGKARTK